MAKSEQINELALAISKVQGEIEGASKDSMNPHFKSKYADLTSCWQACREQLTKNGVAIIQSGDDTETHLVVITTLMHSSGQWIDGTLKFEKMITDSIKDPADYKKVIGYRKRDMTAQDIGSCLTYLRRYSLCMMVGICPEDDDGNAASGNPNKQRVEQKQRLLSAIQVNELENILKNCDESYLAWHNNNLKTGLKVNSISELCQSYYEPIKNSALKNIEDNLKLKKQSA